tara:strand:+ start:293 stop:2014 length:1722 start_codon:yes stop_codon:yes gene_type:complete
MKKLLKIIFIVAITFSFNTNLFGQEISKEEKKQRKKDFKILVEKIKDTVPLNIQITRNTSTGRMDTINKWKLNLVGITFISKSLEYADEISQINKLDLYKDIKFFDIFRDAKNIFEKNNVYVYKDGFGKSYPSLYNMNDFIKCEELLHIYNFQIQVHSEYKAPVDYLVLEYKENLNNSQLSYVAIKKSEFERSIKILNKSRELKEQIANQEFIISYNNISGYSGSCFKGKLLSRTVFFIVNTDSANNSLKDEAKKLFDTPNFHEKDFKSKPSNISSGYDYIDFDLDSIKFYQLDIMSFLNSGILKDSIDLFKYVSELSYKELNNSIGYYLKRVGDNYTAEEVEKMSEIDYWEKTLPKGEEFKQFVNEIYIKLTPRVNIKDYMNNSEINNSKFNFSQFVFDHKDKYPASYSIRGSVCSNNYCKNECNRSLKGTGKMDVRCYLNLEGKQYSRNKYFYTSPDLKILRDDVVTLLAEIFCKKSGAMNSEKKKKEKEQQYLNALAKEYGLKYAKAAVVGDIIIGMPEDLLTIPLRAWNIKSNTQWKKGYRIYCTFKFNTSKKLIVYVYDGKVASISNW